MSRTLTWIVPGDPDQRTGGYLYDARIVAELRALGWRVAVIGLAGRFPDPDPAARQSLYEALGAAAAASRVVIDGLALGGLPEVAAEHGERLDITALVHHPLADETGLDPAARDRFLRLERQALANCRRVIVTSEFTARRLVDLGLLDDAATVIEPGVDPAELAGPVAARLAGDSSPTTERLLCVASLTPRKAQDILIKALARLPERSWQCVLAGSAERDPGFAERVHQLIETTGLTDRIDRGGELDTAALAGQYRQASVCVLPSHYEGYGMVVTEALARGLPLITTHGGALAETVPAACSLQVSPGDVDLLTDALRRWLDDPELRVRLTRAAAEARRQLPDWPQAGRAFAAALDG